MAFRYMSLCSSSFAAVDFPAMLQPASSPAPASDGDSPRLDDGDVIRVQAEIDDEEFDEDDFDEEFDDDFEEIDDDLTELERELAEDEEGDDAAFEEDE